MNKKFAILITTKNRLEDLLFTLNSITALLSNESVECIICDDGSTDGTYEYLKNHFPEIILFRNEISKGLIYSRNRLMASTTAEYAISIDDDLHFITENPLEIIERYFQKNENCGLISFRIFWSRSSPKTTITNQKSEIIRSFAGGAHVWKTSVWKAIPNYPEWFIFYGEEDFASYHLFKKKIEIHYLPDILVHHRVDLLSRKKNKDYILRTRRSIRSGWYLYFMFYPWNIIPGRLLYTFWKQIKTKTGKGDFKATIGVFQAILDVMINLPKLLKNSNRLTENEFEELLKVSEVKLYWKPEDEK